jgi:twitching motility protein PilI
MSQKEALQALHSRLAGRMQATASDTSSPAWLAVYVGGQGYLFPLSQSGEIFPWVEPHNVPHTKDWFLGVANLRGTLCGVASLRKYLERETVPDIPHKNTRPVNHLQQEKRLIGFHPSFEMNTVLAVDQLAGLKNLDHMELTENQNIFLDKDLFLWRQIDLGMLARNPNFIDIQLTPTTVNPQGL